MVMSHYIDVDLFAHKVELIEHVQEVQENRGFNFAEMGGL